MVFRIHIQERQPAKVKGFDRFIRNDLLVDHLTPAYYFEAAGKFQLHFRNHHSRQQQRHLFIFFDGKPGPGQIDDIETNHSLGKWMLEDDIRRRNELIPGAPILFRAEPVGGQIERLQYEGAGLLSERLPDYPAFAHIKGFCPL